MRGKILFAMTLCVFVAAPTFAGAEQSRRDVFATYCNKPASTMPAAYEKLSRGEIRDACGGTTVARAQTANTWMREYVVGGQSMQHLGILDGQVINVEMGAAPQVGDVIVFASQACGASCVKKLTKRNGNCYWIEGRPGYWGNGNYSIDSTRLGWLCGSEISITGVVRS